MGRAIDHKGEVLDASRPGLKTLYVILAGIALFLVYQLWIPLKAMVGMG
ncbi:MAG: hypothetical protein ACM30I_08885 [Gemmatimonas sp.]